MGIGHGHEHDTDALRVHWCMDRVNGDKVDKVDNISYIVEDTRMLETIALRSSWRLHHKKIVRQIKTIPILRIYCSRQM